jgi:type IV secretory pathway VirB4 component
MFGLANGDDRLRHMYLIGKSGTGKSTLLESMISQDIANGAVV